jgi:hypothetical protein
MATPHIDFERPSLEAFAIVPEQNRVLVRGRDDKDVKTGSFSKLGICCHIIGQWRLLWLWQLNFYGDDYWSLGVGKRS